MTSSSAFNPSPSAVARVLQLPEMTMDEIKALWRELYRKEPPTHVRSFLEKRLAFRLQEVEFRRAHPGIAEKNERRINAIMATGNKPLGDRIPQPMAGTVLSRRYQDIDYTVTVTHDGHFEFNGAVYKSLSIIAREITGTRWSGPLFFGLRKSFSKKKTKRSKK